MLMDSQEFKDSLAEVERRHQPDADEDEASKENILRGLKEDVNNFLWARLPTRTTLGEADALAIAIFDSVVAHWDKQGKT